MPTDVPPRPLSNLLQPLDHPRHGTSVYKEVKPRAVPLPSTTQPPESGKVWAEGSDNPFTYGHHPHNAHFPDADPPPCRSLSTVAAAATASSALGHSNHAVWVGHMPGPARGPLTLDAKAKRRESEKTRKRKDAKAKRRESEKTRKRKDAKAKRRESEKTRKPKRRESRCSNCSTDGSQCPRLSRT
jgi:hypothetical protein